MKKKWSATMQSRMVRANDLGMLPMQRVVTVNVSRPVPSPASSPSVKVSQVERGVCGSMIGGLLLFATSIVVWLVSTE